MSFDDVHFYEIKNDDVIDFAVISRFSIEIWL